MILQGKCISPGLAQGRAHVFGPDEWLDKAAQVPLKTGPEEEIVRLQAARIRAGQELDRVRRQLIQQGRNRDAAIFAAHATMLTDKKFNERIVTAIRLHSVSAEAAIARVVLELQSTFRESGLPIIQDKMADLLDIGRRLIQCLDDTAELDTLVADVAVATTVMPSELVRLAHQGVAAIVTETCGLKSHTAILARGLGVPLVTGIHDAVTRIPEGATITVDAAAGTVVVNPTPDELETERRIREQIAQVAPVSSESAPEITAPTTQDGVAVTVLLNISDPIEADAVHRLGAAGVGLFRTEFLYMDRTDWPTELESQTIYERVAKSIGNGELHIRLADFGAEKCPSYADIPINRNPSLGVRGVRLLLQRPDILQPQVAAIARLARQRRVTLLLPMIDTIDTLEAITTRLCEICECRTREELPFGIATMIEVPAAAMMIEDVLPKVDAVSIGLNDLTQYLLAADRDDEVVESYHDALQPAVLRLVNQVIDAAGRHHKPVTICGELAGDATLTTVMLALGLRRFSVSRSHYRNIIAMLGQLNVAELQPRSQELLQLSSGHAVREFLSNRFFS